MTAVRPGPSGVAWVSTTEPSPSPRTMVMTIVRGSGECEARIHLDAHGPRDAIGHAHGELIVVGVDHLQAREAVRVEVRRRARGRGGWR